MALRAFQDDDWAKQGTTASEQEGHQQWGRALPAGSGRERARAVEADQIWWVAVARLGSWRRKEVRRGRAARRGPLLDREQKQRDLAGQR